MRQAGRSDPAYRALRNSHPQPLEELFRDVDAAVEISLLPLRIGVDAVIFFQDILTPLAPMGASFIFRPGPTLEQPVISQDQVSNIHHYDIAQELPFIGETLGILRKTLDNRVPLLGFAGAPFTLLAFMIEGKSPGTAETVARILKDRPAWIHPLLTLLADITADYLNFQITSGAQAIQLFESCADLLSPELYKEFALPYQQQVFAKLPTDFPGILFAKNCRDLSLLKASGAGILSLSSHTTICEARTVLGQTTRLQGNVSNQLLASGNREAIQSAVVDCVKSGQHTGHVLNLDHGVLQQTDWEAVEWFVECARQIRNNGYTGPCDISDSEQLNGSPLLDQS
jgi:uroporphyrinogen decarboxylase